MDVGKNESSVGNTKWRKNYLRIYSTETFQKVGSLPSSFSFTGPLKIEGAKCGAKGLFKKELKKVQTDGASKDKLGVSWVEDSNSLSHNTLLHPSRPGQKTQDKLHRELQQT